MIRDERGVTLVELILVIAIMALITGALVGVIYQILDITGRGNSELVVQHDLRNAAVWLNRDVLSASKATVTQEGDDYKMVLEVPYLETSPEVTTTNRYITYTYYEDTGDLARDSDGSSHTIARHIVTNPFPPLGTIIEAPSVVTITLVSLEGKVPVSSTFALKMRTGGSMQIVAICQIIIGQFDVYTNTVSLVVTNSGGDLATIKQIEIGWPSDNQALSMIKFNAITETIPIPIWAGDEDPPSVTIHKPEWAGEPDNLKIAGGLTQKTLALDFELNAAVTESLYSVRMIFDNGCTVDWP